MTAIARPSRQCAVSPSRSGNSTPDLIHFTMLYSWLKKADIEDGERAGSTSVEAAELRAAQRRINTLEQENEVLRRAAAYFAQAARQFEKSHLGSPDVPLTEHLTNVQFGKIVIKLVRARTRGQRPRGRFGVSSADAGAGHRLPLVAGSSIRLITTLGGRAQT
jgi:hypothetical protein